MTGLALDPRAFRAWLLSWCEGAVVGRAVQARWCPLAAYLSERDGCGYSVVGNCCTRELGAMPYEMFLLPAWAEEFVLQVDIAHGEGAPVLREAALAVLNQVLAEGGEEGEEWGTYR